MGMNTQHKNAKLVRPVTPGLLPLAVILLAVPASAQFNSSAASVALVARVPESVTVQYQSIPLPLGFADGENSPVEVVQVVLHWRLQQGQKVQVQSSVETADQKRPLLAASGFVGMKELALAGFISSFAPQTESGTVLLGALSDPEEKPVGRASLLLGTARGGQTDHSTLRITVAVL